MPRPVHFEFTANDPEAIAGFYGSVFGWKFHKWEGPMDYWLIQTGEEDMGIDGGMGRRGEGQTGTTNTIDVPDVDAFVERITQSGGTIVLPKMAIPGVGWLAYANDPDGNPFGIMQSDDAAA